MDLIKIRFKLFNLLSLFFLFNLISQIFCLLEFPIKLIDSAIIPKYKGYQFDNKISQHIKNILNINSVSNYTFNNFKDIKLSSESGDINLITSYLLSIKIELGTSNQEFNLILDTGSTITWVPLINSADLYPIKHHYNPSISSKSKKLNEDFIIKYGTGSCFGNYYKDEMKYINNKEFDMVFGAAEETIFNVNDVDGIIGLSRIYDDNSKSFIHMLCRGGITKSKIFSFKLGLNLTLENPGKFYIGKHDDFDKDNVARCEMKNSDYYEKNLWACEMSSFSIVNNNDYIKLTSKKKISVIFDSGTNAIFLPLYYLGQMENDLDKLNCKAIKDSSISSINRYQLICKGEVPDFHLVIGGHTFILPGKYFFYFNQLYASSKIIFQDSFDDGNNLFIIGSPFFMLFHILFDSYSKELHFYPEKDEFLIKGTWWNSKHIIVVIIFVFIFIAFIILIVLLIIWKRKNLIEIKESYEITSFYGLL